MLVGVRKLMDEADWGGGGDGRREVEEMRLVESGGWWNG